MGGEGKRRASPRRRSAERDEAFFEALSQSCNVQQSAALAGMDTGQIYRRRLEDSAFAERWQKAVAIGYSRVEERLIRDAMGEQGPDAQPMDKYDRELALNLLKFHHNDVVRAYAGGKPVTRASEAETDAAILSRLAAVKRRMAG